MCESDFNQLHSNRHAQPVQPRATTTSIRAIRTAALAFDIDCVVEVVASFAMAMASLALAAFFLAPAFIEPPIPAPTVLAPAPVPQALILRLLVDVPVRLGPDVCVCVCVCVRARALARSRVCGLCTCMHVLGF